MKELIDLYCTFFKIGLQTFGGGHAMMPILDNELVNKKKWVTEVEMLDYFTIGQCTPGIMAVNTATFVGCKRKGVIGALFSTLGIITPSFLIITLIAMFFDYFIHMEILSYALNGIRVAVSALIFNSIINMFKIAVIDKITLTVYLFFLVCAIMINVNPALLIVASGAVGILLPEKKEKKI